MIIAYFIIFFTFFCHIPQVPRISLSVFRVVRGFTLSFLQVSNPHMPAVGSGWRLLAILADRKRAKKTNYKIL